MKTCRAKFECGTVIPAHQGYDAVAYLTAVISNPDGSYNKENESFSNSTPSGMLQISISQDVPAHKFFKPGRSYYLDFTLVPLTEQEIANALAWKQMQEAEK